MLDWQVYYKFPERRTNEFLSQPSNDPLSISRTNSVRSRWEFLEQAGVMVVGLVWLEVACCALQVGCVTAKAFQNAFSSRCSSKSSCKGQDVKVSRHSHTQHTHTKPTNQPNQVQPTEPLCQ